MPLRREDEGFWTWFTDCFAYRQDEAAWVPAEFVKADETFDVYTWYAFIEEQQQAYAKHLGNI